MKVRVILALVAVLVVSSAGSGLAAQAREDKKDKGDDARKARSSPLLEALGTATAANLYQTYLNVGFLADGRAEGVYDDRTAQRLLGSILGLLDAVDKQLTKVGKTELEKKERQALEKIREVYGLIRKQANALQTFWKSGKKADGARYEKLRKEAWQEVKQLLDLQDES